MPTLTVTFSENLFPEGIVADHVLLTSTSHGSFVPSALDFNTGTQVLTITYADDLPQDVYTLTLVSGEQDEGLSDSSVNALDGEFTPGGGFPSGDGRAGGDFVADFSVNTPPRVITVLRWSVRPRVRCSILNQSIVPATAINTIRVATGSGTSAVNGPPTGTPYDDVPSRDRCV